MGDTRECQSYCEPMSKAAICQTEPITRILVPSGVLGLGFDAQALAQGLTLKPHAICIDGGSTDSGPFYLGSGSSKYSDAVIRHEWRELMRARAQLNIPLIIGSCGTCGTDNMVNWMFEITRDIAQELQQSIRVTRLYSSQDPAELQRAFIENRISALEPQIPLDQDRLAGLSNIVALAGAEQIAAALDESPDIILAGRTTDTAVIAALPLLRGAAAGAAWHGSKIAECGALCSDNPTSGVILVDFDDEGFEVQALAQGAVCTPQSVSAHMLYENADPIRLHEPGGALDVAQAQYIALDNRRVRVTGSRWIKQNQYTVKLEGAQLAGYQTVTLVLLRQPEYVKRAQEWCNSLQQFLTLQVQEKMQLNVSQYDLELRLLGCNATLGQLENLSGDPAEVGVLAIVTAQSQERATDIARLCNPHLLHYPLSKTESLPTFAFPFSPAESARGPLYEFALNHVLELKSPMDAFRFETDELTYANAC